MDNSVLWYSDGIVEESDSLNYSHTSQRENDGRDVVFRTGITGYLEATFEWDWTWSPGYSATSQSFYFETSTGTTVHNESGSGSSGTKTFTISNLDFNETYRIRMTSASSLGEVDETTMTASGTLDWTYKTYG